MSYPDYGKPLANGPGLLFVNSKIINPELETEAFTKWYETVHIPDIFTSGTIKTANRYYSTTPNKVDKPYLAYYPVENVEVLQSKEFKSIPVHSDYFPGDKLCFSHVYYDVRYNLHLKSTGDPSNSANFLIVVNFGKTVDDAAALKLFEVTSKQLQSVRMSLFKTYFARQGRDPDAEKALQEVPKYLLIADAETEISEQVLAGLHKDGATTVQFELLKAFGDKVKVHQ